MKALQRAKIALAAAVPALLTPALAFADDSESSGLDLLIPKVGEFVPALIVFLIIVFVFGKFAWPAVLDMLDEREKRIDEGIKTSDEAKAEAEKTHEESEEILEDARRQAAEIINDAQKEATQERNRIVGQAHEEADRILAEAHADAEEDVQRVYENATDTVAKVSVAVAAKIVGDTLENDEEKQRELIKKYLSEVGDLNA